MHTDGRDLILAPFFTLSISKHISTPDISRYPCSWPWIPSFPYHHMDVALKRLPMIPVRLWMNENGGLGLAGKRIWTLRQWRKVGLGLVISTVSHTLYETKWILVFNQLVLTKGAPPCVPALWQLSKPHRISCKFISKTSTFMNQRPPNHQTGQSWGKFPFHNLQKKQHGAL